jgi:hypothetical protein
MPREVKQSYTKTIFPKPPAYKMSLAAFEKWLRSFDEESRNRVTLSLYRDWPRINLKQIPGEQYERRIYFYEASLDSVRAVFDENFSFREFVLRDPNFGGEGEYRMLCNEQGVKGAIGSTEFTIEDVDYPPRVDVRSVVLGWPRNEGFIKGLRAKGIRIPGDNPALDQIEQEEHEEMNIAQPLLDATIRRSEKLEETVDELKEQVREARTSATSTEPRVRDHAEMEGIRVMGEAARESNRMVADTAREISKATAPSFDPIALFKVGMEANTRTDNSLAVAQLFIQSNERALQQVHDMHKETMEVMKQILERDEEPEVTAVQKSESGSAMDELDREMERLERMAKYFGWKRPGTAENGASNAPVVAPGFFDKIGKWVSENPMMGLAALALGANIVYNFRSGTPIPPDKALEAAGVPKGTLPAVHGQPAATAPAPDQTQQAAQENWKAFMTFITPHFLAHYTDQANADLNGYTFAADIHTLVETPSGMQIVSGTPATILGRTQYENIVKQGPMVFDKWLRAWPPIWSVISKNPTTPANPEHYQKFFAEFFSYDQFAKKEAGVQ